MLGLSFGMLELGRPLVPLAVWGALPGPGPGVAFRAVSYAMRGRRTEGRHEDERVLEVGACRRKLVGHRTDLAEAPEPRVQEAGEQAPASNRGMQHQSTELREGTSAAV